MSSTTRKALRDFYKLPSETHSKPTPDEAANNGNVESGPENFPVEQDEDGIESTKLQELDTEEVKVEDFVNNLAHTESLESFVAIADQIKREEQMLASAQRELVNDNYKKLIRAAETLNYLSSQGDLAGVKNLEEPVLRLTEWSQNLSK